MENGMKTQGQDYLAGFCRPMLIVLCAGLVMALFLSPFPVMAQMGSEGVISTQGTQFVGEDPEPQPPPAKDNKPVPLPPAQEPERVAPPQPQPVAPAKPNRYPSVVILLDTSDSMLTKVPSEDMTRLDEAKEALVDVVSGMSSETRVQLWIFNTRLIPVAIRPGMARRFIPIGPSGNRTELIRKIKSIRTGGGTNLYQSIIKVLEVFGEARDQAAYRSRERFPVLVVISDGEDAMKTGHSLDAVLAVRKRYPLVTINTIGFHVSGERSWTEKLCQIANTRQGCANADDSGQLRKILEGFYRPRQG